MSGRHRLAVASAEHVRRGRAQGFMQVSHGKRAPLARVKPGDGIVYYSPTTVFRGADRLMALTAIGVVREGEPYAFDMGGGFVPFRRDVDWHEASEIRIAPLLDALDLTRGRKSWGYALRFGLVEIGGADYARLFEAMGARRAA